MVKSRACGKCDRCNEKLIVFIKCSLYNIIINAERKVYKQENSDMVVSEKKYTLQDLKIGMLAEAEQLTEIYNKYMILLFEDAESKTGKLVYCKDIQDKEYDSWFMQPKPIKPIYNDRDLSYEDL